MFYLVNIYETQIRDKPENGIWAFIIYSIYFKFSLIHLLSENLYITKLSHSFFIDLFQVLMERNAILGDTYNYKSIETLIRSYRDSTPHEFILNHDFLANFVSVFAERVTHFLPWISQKYAESFTFRGGSIPII